MGPQMKWLIEMCWMYSWEAVISLSSRSYGSPDSIPIELEVCVCVCCYQKYFNEGATRQAIDFYDFNCTFIDIFSVEFFLQLFTLFKLFFVYLKPHLFSYLKQRSIQECNPMPTVVNVYDDTENIISVVCLFISAEPNFRNELWKQFPKSGCDTISI